MECKVPCNLYYCNDDCDEHAYCDKHFKEALDEQFEAGKKEGYNEAEKEFNK